MTTENPFYHCLEAEKHSTACGCEHCSDSCDCKKDCFDPNRPEYNMGMDLYKSLKVKLKNKERGMSDLEVLVEEITEMLREKQRDLYCCETKDDSELFLLQQWKRRLELCIAGEKKIIDRRIG